MPRQTITGTVGVREGIGSEIVVHVLVDATAVRPTDIDDPTASAGMLLVGRLDPNSRLQIGDTAVLAVSTARMHFFDLDTGLAIRAEAVRATM